MRQRRWIELFSDYDCEIRYLPGKANVVANALNMILAAQKEAVDEVAVLQKGLDELIEQRSHKTLYYLDRIWVPLKGEVRTLIMDEAHKSKYSVHPGADKMYWWPGMKKDISEYVSVRCAPFEVAVWLESVFTYCVGFLRLEKKSYAKKRRKPLEFSIGYYVFLKVSPWKGVVRLRKKGKLAPRFVGPFEILEKVGPVAYRLDLLEELNGVHARFTCGALSSMFGCPTMQVPSLDEI
ncbi:putative reverse transcriptase domain-containing protein [Tanacetum coccineum]